MQEKRLIMHLIYGVKYYTKYINFKSNLTHLSMILQMLNLFPDVSNRLEMLAMC